MVSVDITCDLMDEDETGLVWTFLREARDPAVAEVIHIVRRPAGEVVHLRVLPGVIEDYEALVRRANTPARGIGRSASSAVTARPVPAPRP